MELKYLQTFQVVVQEGGFSKAADKLNYTQSTITFQMKELEQELGVRLFDKVGRRIGGAGKNAELSGRFIRLHRLLADWCC